MSVVQRSLVAGSLAMAMSVVAYFEGRELIGYLDPVGIPTVCYGHTATAEVGKFKTDEECEQLLQEDLGWALDAVDKQLPGVAPATRAALGSFVYNVGVRNFESSTLLRKARAGDLAGACNELPRWVYAKGRKLNGLVRRRTAERELCLEGLKHEQNSDKPERGPVAVRGPALVAAEQQDRAPWQHFSAAGNQQDQG